MHAILSFCILAVFGALANADVIANEKCITIMDEAGLVMQEKMPNIYLRMVTKGPESNHQRWILESVGGDFYKLKNKHSGRYMVMGVADYLLTANGNDVKPRDYFKFVDDGTGKFDIVNNVNGRPSSEGLNKDVRKSTTAQHFTVKNCEQ
uniref:Erythema protein SVEP n=1 Tax=Simulium guianense TaxID=445764 RepID=F5GTZ7_SIMGU